VAHHQSRHIGTGHRLAGIASVGAVAVPVNANVVWRHWRQLPDRSAIGRWRLQSTDGAQRGPTGPARYAAYRPHRHPSTNPTSSGGALGHLGTPNQERGVFKTTDGGRTWQKQLFVNETSGAVDLAIDYRIPTCCMPPCTMPSGFPEIMEASGGGISRPPTAGQMGEGGERLRKHTGRIGIDLPQESRLIYAVIDNSSASAQRSSAILLRGQLRIGGEVYRTRCRHTWHAPVRSEDVSASWLLVNQLRVDPTIPSESSSPLEHDSIDDGGKTWAGSAVAPPGGYLSFHLGDFRSFGSTEDSDRMIATSDGASVSYDGAARPTTSPTSSL